MSSTPQRPNRNIGQILRSIARGLVVALRGLGVLVCLLGIGAIWRFRGSLEERGTVNLARLVAALGVANASLQAVNTNLDAIDAAQLAAAGRTLVAIPDIIVALNGTLQAVNNVPF